MTWRRATAILLGAWISLAVALYVRDLGDSPPPPTANEASFDGRRVLAGITGGQCRGGCAVDVLGQSAVGVWRIRLTAGPWRRCYDLDPTAFRYSDHTGFTGVKTAPCRA